MKNVIHIFSDLNRRIGDRVRPYLARKVNDGSVQSEGRLILKKNASLLIKKEGLLKTGAGTVTVREGSRIIVESGARLLIGNDVGINSNCYIAVHDTVTIGNDTIFGPGVVLVDHDHDHRAEGGLKAGAYKVGSVHIGSNVWIGANAVILKNANIGDNVVIGAGSVVRGDIPDNSLAVGNPARIVS